MAQRNGRTHREGGGRTSNSVALRPTWSEQQPLKQSGDTGGARRPRHPRSLPGGPAVGPPRAPLWDCVREAPPARWPEPGSLAIRQVRGQEQPRAGVRVLETDSGPRKGDRYARSLLVQLRQAMPGLGGGFTVHDRESCARSPPRAPWGRRREEAFAHSQRHAPKWYSAWGVVAARMSGP